MDGRCWCLRPATAQGERFGRSPSPSPATSTTLEPPSSLLPTIAPRFVFWISAVPGCAGPTRNGRVAIPLRTAARCPSAAMRTNRPALSESMAPPGKSWPAGRNAWASAWPTPCSPLLPALGPAWKLGLWNVLKMAREGITTTANFARRHFRTEAARRLIPGLALHVDLGPKRPGRQRPGPGACLAGGPRAAFASPWGAHAPSPRL